MPPRVHRFDDLELPASADFHVHLRDGPMMEAVVPMIRQGGVDTVYVMVWDSSGIWTKSALTCNAAQLGPTHHNC